LIDYWGANTGVSFIMLCGYFDESGEHRNGKLVRMSVAGCIADVDLWRPFCQEWQSTLDTNQIETFHAQEFFARKIGRSNPYFGWTDARRKNYLDALVGSMRHVRISLGQKFLSHQTKRLQDIHMLRD
jgi:hypothetical protein